MNDAHTNLIDARERLTLAAIDLEEGMTKTREAYRKGLLTDTDFTDRVAFLLGRHNAALDDFSRARRNPLAYH